MSPPVTRAAILARHGLPDDAPLYLRFGEIPADERSGIGGRANIYSPVRSNHELGVSVYELEFCDDGLLALGEQFCNVTTAAELLAQFERGHRKCYIVTGRHVRYDELTRAEKQLTEWTHNPHVFGSDSEPLLRQVRVLERVEPFTVRGHGFHEPDIADVALWAELDAIEREAAERATAGPTP